MQFIGGYEDHIWLQLKMHGMNKRYLYLFQLVTYILGYIKLNAKTLKIAKLGPLYACKSTKLFLYPWHLFIIFTASILDIYIYIALCMCEKH